MIEEAYVSFEVAKLLKEKGFDAECRAAYTNYGKLFTTQIQQYITNALCSKGTLWDCTAPTLQMAMKWLREVHNLYIDIRININDSLYSFRIYSVGISGARAFTEYRIKSYEAACEEAIKYCIENII